MGQRLKFTIIALVLFISLKSLAQQPVTGVYYCSYDKQKAIRIDTLETGFVAKSSDLLLTYRNKQYNLKYNSRSILFHKSVLQPFKKIFRMFFTMNRPFCPSKQAMNFQISIC
jgi:hypothetical protein